MITTHPRQDSMTYRETQGYRSCAGGYNGSSNEEDRRFRMGSMRRRAARRGQEDRNSRGCASIRRMPELCGQRGEAQPRGLSKRRSLLCETEGTSQGARVARDVVCQRLPWQVQAVKDGKLQEAVGRNYKQDRRNDVEREESEGKGEAWGVRHAKGV